MAQHFENIDAIIKLKFSFIFWYALAEIFKCKFYFTCKKTKRTSEGIICYMSGAGLKIR